MYNEAPPPPPNHAQNQSFPALPDGWSTAVSPEDGRVYYWEKGTGRTSWVHPHALMSAEDPPSKMQHGISPVNIEDGQTSTASSRPSSPDPSGSFWAGGTKNFFFARGNFCSRQEPILATAASQSSAASVGSELPLHPADRMARIEYLETPWMASPRKPYNHQFNALVALVLCFPIGICALIHSFSCDNSWNEGRYSEAVRHARKAHNYACVGTGIGIIFWIYWLLFRPGQRFDDLIDYNGFHLD